MTTTPLLIPAGAYTVDRSRSRVEFAVKHLGIATVRGSFGAFEGSLQLPADLTAAEVSGTVDVATVDTGDAVRDRTLRSAGLFGAERHPKLTFASRAITATDDDTLQIAGDLSIRGVTREIILTAQVTATEKTPSGEQRFELKVTGQLSRGDYGIAFDLAHGQGDALVSDKVKLALAISAVKDA